MKDLSHPRLIKLKGALFLFAGLLAAFLLLSDAPSPRSVFLLGVCVWSFCRFYYFAFYVIQHYIDPSFRFSGLGSFLRWLLKRRDKTK